MAEARFVATNKAVPNLDRSHLPLLNLDYMSINLIDKLLVSMLGFWSWVELATILEWF